MKKRQFRLARTSEFHLQGEHDQQSHAGGRGAGESAGSTVGPEGDSAAATRSLGKSVKLPSRAELENSFDPIPETPEIESTFLDHMDENGNLSAERQKVHDDLIEKGMTQPEKLPNKEPNPKAGEPLPSQDKPKALMLGGGAASGKSSSQKAGFVDTPEGAVVVNPDEFKVLLPESAGPASDGRQGNGLADEVGPAWASITHEESSYLGKRLTTAAIDNKQNIVLDKTSSKPAKAVEEIQRLQKAGYDVDVAYVTTDIDRAVGAAIRRQEEIGRAVPESELRAGHSGANQAFLAVATETTARSQLLTTIPDNPDGTRNPPVLTAVSTGDGRIQVINQDAWSAYLTRVPNVPDDLDDILTAELAAAIRALVASSGTVGSVIYIEDDDRRKVLYGHALAGKTPSSMTPDEQTYFDQVVVEIAELRERGIAPDWPIDDIFDDEGVIAVTGGDDGQMSARTFRVQNPS